MQQSDELQRCGIIIFRELEKLDLKTLRCGIGIINGENKIGECLDHLNNKGRTEVNYPATESMDIHPV